MARSLHLVLIATAVGSLHAQTELTAKAIYAPEHLVRVDVEMKPADWDKLRAQTRLFTTALTDPTVHPFTWFRGHVTIDGVRIENVGIRKKGFIGSMDRHRPSLKIKFAEFEKQQPAQGFDRLTLNNNKQDRSLMSQVLAYRLYRKAGVHAPRCNHARVTVNGKLLGIYANVESIKAPFLEHSFGAADGDLYEGTVADFYPDTVEKFQIKTRKSDRAPLERLAKLFAADELDLGAIEKTLDLESFLGFWGVESIIGLWDAYANNQNNYYVYRNPKNGRLSFIPWGADDAFTNTMPFPPFVILTKSVHCQAVVPNRLYELAAVQKRYREKLESILASVWNEEELNAVIERAKERLTPHLHRTQRDFGRGRRKIRGFIRSRRKVIQRDLRRWPLELPNGPRRPYYAAPHGTAEASFNTEWNGRAKDADARLELVINGKPVEFRLLRIGAARSTWPTLDGSPPPPAITITCKRVSDNVKVTIGVSPEHEDFRPTGSTPVIVQGIMMGGKTTNPMGFKMVSGKAWFDAAAMKSGAPVRGRMKLEIVEMRGGKPAR